jgi:hypothetical protein
MSKIRSMPMTIKVASAQVPDTRENVDAVGLTGLVTAEMAAEKSTVHGWTGYRTSSWTQGALVSARKA